MIDESLRLRVICVGINLNKTESGVTPLDIIVIEVFSPPKIC